MNRTLIIILALLLSISFTGQPLRSQVAPAKFKVAVHVKASEKEIHQSIVESHIRSELRRLDDVEIVKFSERFPKWEFLIAVHVMESKYKSGELAGDACIDTTFFKKTATSYFRPGWIDHFTEFPTVLFPPAGRMYISWKTENLDQLSKMIVSDFESDVLEIYRK